MVTSLNEDNESVTVEWIENGDTKGKGMFIRLNFISSLKIKIPNMKQNRKLP